MTSQRQTAFSFRDPKAMRVAILLLLILGTVIFVRIRLLDVPLERDEGEFAYGAQMFLQGLSPYKHACTVMLKLPGTCAAYALAMGLFEQPTVAIHLELILITLATTLLVFFLARRIYGDGAGLVAAATYALLAMNPASLGLAAHATHYVVLPALAGIFLLQPLDDETSLNRIFFAGLLLGVAVLMKQTGAAFGLFAALWVVRCEVCSAAKSKARLAGRLVALAAGGLLPFLVTCCVIALSGDWDQFVFWTFKYAGLHAHILTFAQGIEAGVGRALELFEGAPGLWSLALIGPFVLWWEPGLRRWSFFVLAFSIFSFLAAYPGWRAHYFIQAFPAAGLLAGATFRASATFLERLKAPRFAWAILGGAFLAAGASTLIQWEGVYFTETPAQVSRAIYGSNPFPEAVKVADYLATHCSKDATIAVLGSEPEIYVYSHCRAATKYVCTYPLMEPHAYALAMQKQMTSEIEENNPEYVVFVSVDFSWSRHPESETFIFDWFNQYNREHLRKVGDISIGPDCWLGIYKRRDAN